MKCREFQFGDWCRNEYGLPMQMVDLGEDYAYATYEGDEGYPWLFSDNKDDQPHPIEITRELLEANGWRAESFTTSPWDGSVQTYYFVKDESDIHLEFACDTLTICFNYENGIDAVSGVSADIMIPVQYVHQIQHVLRLAGLTDMANNFKV